MLQTQFRLSLKGRKIDQAETNWASLMKVYLDDLRPTPAGWIRVYWPFEAIDLLIEGGVEVISLDHDLGDDTQGTGYDVLTWLEQHVQDEPTFVLPEVLIHTANSSARKRMQSALKSILRAYESTRGAP